MINHLRPLRWWGVGAETTRDKVHVLCLEASDTEVIVILALSLAYWLVGQMSYHDKETNPCD